MECPSIAARSEAAAAEPSRETNDHYLRNWPCLNTLEVRPAPAQLPQPRALRVAAWNIERCKRVEDSVDLLRRIGADVVLATELDIGMARSSQRNTVRDLADGLGFGYAFGTEFVELGTGDPFETSLFADVPNTHGLHGNAILSRYPLKAPRVIRLEESGLWYIGAPKADGQRRVGGRMAVAAEVETAFGSLTCVAVHYESEADAGGRNLQTRTLLQSVSSRRAVIGGDLNTADLAGYSTAERLLTPDLREPCFTTFSGAGFDWRTSNTGAVTTRAAPGRAVKDPLKTIDWLLVRGVAAVQPEVHPALSDRGEYLSDHELILATICERPEP